MKFSKHADALQPSETKKYKPVIEQLRKEGHTIIDFGHGDTNLSVSVNTTKRMALALEKYSSYKYSSSQGNSQLLDYLSATYGVEKANIVIGPGAKMLLKMASELLYDADDTVVVVAPYWPTYKSHSGMSDAHLVPFYLDKNLEFNTSKFSEFMDGQKSVKALILNNPNNPSGKVFSKEELEFVCNLCWKRGIIVIADEVYSEFIHTAQPFYSLLNLTGAQENLDKILIVNSSSKNLGMSGFRVAFMIAHADFIKKSIQYMSQTISNVPDFIQTAYLDELQNTEHQRLNMKIIKERFEIAKDEILKSANFKLHTYGGTIYVFPEIVTPLKIDMSTFVLNLLTIKHVSVLPGEPFGYTNNIRICIGNCQTNEVAEGIKRIDDYINEVKQ